MASDNISMFSFSISILLSSCFIFMEHKSKIDARNYNFMLPCEKCIYFIMLSEFGNEKAAADLANAACKVL